MYIGAKNHKYLEAYSRFVVVVMTLFGASKDTVKTDVKDMVDFEVKLANVSMNNRIKVSGVIVLLLVNRLIGRVEVALNDPSLRLNILKQLAFLEHMLYQRYVREIRIIV